LGDALVGPVPRLEVTVSGQNLLCLVNGADDRLQGGGPVVREVLAELARGARRLSRHILRRVHGNIEGVLTTVSMLLTETRTIHTPPTI
jgi:hypothetical protein